jgi:hypothetical protein
LLFELDPEDHIPAISEEHSSKPDQAMMTPTESQNMLPKDTLKDAVEDRHRAVHIGKLQAEGGDGSERTVATTASSSCFGRGCEQPNLHNAAVIFDTCTPNFLVDYSHRRAPLDRSSGYLIRRITNRSLEKATSQPGRAATLRQERRQSALKANKRGFSKKTTLDDDLVRSAPGTTRASLPVEWPEGDDAPMVGSIDFYKVLLGVPAECVNAPIRVEHEEPVIALQFAFKQRLQEGGRRTSASLSPAPRHCRLPRKCKSTSDTMPRLPTRSASRRQLASTAVGMVQEKQKVEDQDVIRRVQKQVVARKQKARSGGEELHNLQKQNQQRDDTGAGSAVSAANSISLSSSLRKNVGGIFKSMSLCKLKKYDQLQDEVEEEEDASFMIQMPASLRPPRVLRLESDDVSDCSSVSMEDDMDHDDEDEESSASYRLEGDDDDGSVGSVSTASSSRRSSSIRDQLAGGSTTLTRRRKEVSSRRQPFPSRWATSSLLDSSSARINQSRRQGSFNASTPCPTTNVLNTNPGLLRFPTIRSFTPSQA